MTSVTLDIGDATPINAVSCCLSISQRVLHLHLSQFETFVNVERLLLKDNEIESSALLTCAKFGYHPPARQLRSTQKCSFSASNGVRCAYLILVVVI